MEFLEQVQTISAMMLLALWLILFKPIRTAEAAIVKYKWDVNYTYVYPDCYRKLTKTINGVMPGPPIEAVQGDTVEVEVKNNLFTENVAMHWHGIRQIGTPWFDGAEGISQCGTQPRDTIVYKFVVDRPGTYMYHAHAVQQMGEGLYGMIRVKTPPGVAEPFDYTDDHQIVLVDWYHKGSTELSIGLLSNPFVWVGAPDSILIDGKGRFDCKRPGSDAHLYDPTNPHCSPYTLKVDPGKTIRLRIGGLTTVSALCFEIEGHEMTVVEADGSYVEPFTVKHLYIHGGETYSVLIHTNQDPSRNYWMVVKDIGHRDATPSGLGILNYSPNPPSNPSTPPPKGPLWNNITDRKHQSHLIKAHHDYITPPPKNSDRMLYLVSEQKMINGQLRWVVNNFTFTHPHTPYLIALKNKFDRTQYAENFHIRGHPKNLEPLEGNGVVNLKFNSTVDVILQNANTSIQSNRSESHPWHFHGHLFWVLAHGEGKFDPSRDTKRFNLVNPIMKHTVSLYPYGWTAVRFRADNPGVWAFHCHVESHFFMGMMVIFAEGIDRVGDLPKSIMGCGETKDRIL